MTSANNQPRRIRASWSPSTAMMPLRFSPALSTNIAATVIVAVLEKPDRASLGDTTPKISSVHSTSSATTSIRSFSVTNKVTAPTSTSSVITRSIGHFRPCCLRNPAP